MMLALIELSMGSNVNGGRFSLCMCLSFAKKRLMEDLVRMEGAFQYSSLYTCILHEVLS